MTGARSQKRRWLAVTLAALVGLLFLAATLHDVDWRRVGEAANGMNVGWLAPAVLLLALAYAARLERWRLLLRPFGTQLGIRHLLAPFLGSFALNNILPLRLGDAARALAFRDQLGVRRAASTATLIVERIFDLWTLTALFVGTNLLLDARPDTPLVQTALVSISLVAFALSAIILFPRTIAYHAAKVLRTRIGAMVPRPLARFGIHTLADIGRSRSAGLLPVLVLSTLAWLLESGVLWFVLKALSFNEAPVVGSVRAMVLGNIGVIIPSTPGHIGTFDLFAKAGLVASGVDSTTAAFAVLLAHSVIWAAITGAGLTALALHSRNGERVAQHANSKMRKTS